MSQNWLIDAGLVIYLFCGCATSGVGKCVTKSPCRICVRCMSVLRSSAALRARGQGGLSARILQDININGRWAAKSVPQDVVICK